jgi:hypothetical protein
MRKGALLVLAGVAGAAFAWRRRAGTSEHVDLHFADGSMISLADESDETRRLLPLAHEVLEAARG